MLTAKDVCLVIPTYNRSEDLDRTLSVMIKNRNIPSKIIIVDQSKDNKTKTLIKSYWKKYPILYAHSKIFIIEQYQPHY